MPDNNPAALWGQRKRDREAAIEAPKFACFAYHSNPVTKVVCQRVQEQPEGKRIYCVANNCQSPWRVGSRQQATEIAPPEPEEILVAVEEPCVTSVRVDATQKLRALEEAAAELHKIKAQLTRTELLNAAAQKLNLPWKTIGTFWDRSTTLEQRKLLLYGEVGAKVTRATEKFLALMKVRDQLRAANKPAPTKPELADMAVVSMRLSAGTIYNFIVEDLTAEELKQLDFAPPRKRDHTRKRYIAALREVRQEMRAKNLPSPGRDVLVEATASRLKVKPITLATFVSKLDADTRRELDLHETRSRLYALLLTDPTMARNGVMGAIAVLRFRARAITLSNLSAVLGVSTAAIKGFLSKHPDIDALLSPKEPLESTPEAAQ